MTKTPEDEIVEEIRRRREAHAASFDHDLKRISADLRREEQQSGAEFVVREAPSSRSERADQRRAWTVRRVELGKETDDLSP